MKKILILLLSAVFGFVFYAYIRDYNFLLVMTGSMHPAIRKGTLLVVKKTSSFGLGDVITYQYKDALVTHRIIEVRGTRETPYFLTAGDANDFADKIPLTRTDVLGKVIFTFPFLGYGVLCLLHPLFLLFFFYVPVGYTFGGYCRQFVNQIGT